MATPTSALPDPIVAAGRILAAARAERDALTTSSSVGGDDRATS